MPGAFKGYYLDGRMSHDRATQAALGWARLCHLKS